ncbi:MAG: hypothetical protein GTN76_14420, partial [Candidatus Aenigmarchaeota archaeon]|nr:hypothetical protein [Candidatus Aenigmarchaeota archaeon]
MDVFDDEKIHVIIYDDLKEDPASVYKRTLQFLKVSLNFQPEFQIINPNRRIISLKL